MEIALRELEEMFDIEIPEFTVAAVKINTEYHHHWYLGTESDIDTKKLENALDEVVKKINRNYEVARTRAINGIKVSKVPPTVLHDCHGHQKTIACQVQIEKVMNEEKFSEWEDFVKSIHQ